MKGIKVLLVSSVAAIGFASCADLGFGVDMDSGISSPYYYGSGPTADGGNSGGLKVSREMPYDRPGYSPGFLPPAPPVIGDGPGSIISPGAKPPQGRPPQNGGGGQIPNGKPLIPGAGENVRPGNGGLPSNPSSVPQGRPERGRNR